MADESESPSRLPAQAATERPPDQGVAASSSDPRDSSVGLVFSLAVELKRRRGVFADRWEARMTALGIVIVTTVIIVFVLVQIFQLLGRMFDG